MTLEEYKKLITSSSIKDWTSIGCWGAGSGPSYRDMMSVWTTGSGEFHNIQIDSHSETFSLKSNLYVSVACGLNHNDDFVEDWANSFPDKKASSSFIDFFFCNQLIFRDIYVSVDGGRSKIPLPDMKVNSTTYEVEALTVPREKYEFYRILNDTEYDYEDYFKRTGIEIIDTSWMT